MSSNALHTSDKCLCVITVMSSKAHVKILVQSCPKSILSWLCLLQLARHEQSLSDTLSLVSAVYRSKLGNIEKSK